MNTPEVKELNRQADYAATNLTQPQSGVWLVDMRKHWGEVVTKSAITLD